MNRGLAIAHLGWLFSSVCSWYGGTMLGPVRFEHIENCARAALGRFMLDEALVPLRKELDGLDEELAALRSQPGTSATVAKGQYENLDHDKAERLIVARKRAIEMLQKRIPQSAATSNAPTVPAEPADGDDELKHPATHAEDNVEPPAVKAEEDDGDLTGWDALG